MTKFNVEDIQQLYSEQAKRHGVGATSTIQDSRTRELEIAALLPRLVSARRVLEVGCGNGYATMRVAAALPQIHITAFDFSESLIAHALKQPVEASRVSFSVGDVLKLKAPEPYDAVYSQRCIQNLVSWDNQKTALRNIVEALKPGASYIMQEGFLTGLNNLNEARAELGIEPIPESWHNHFFDEAKTMDFMRELGCSLAEQDAFLSGYYFGSRVLLPAISPKGKKITSASRLNDYFCALPPAGDFCPMKLLRFVKS
jgi:ubiquinone/menaquinone biosynthesis C-methylase UbiE